VNGVLVLNCFVWLCSTVCVCVCVCLCVWCGVCVCGVCVCVVFVCVVYGCVWYVCVVCLCVWCVCVCVCVVCVCGVSVCAHVRTQVHSILCRCSNSSIKAETISSGRINVWCGNLLETSHPENIDGDWRVMLFIRIAAAARRNCLM
jgi:hypothetical protein